MNLNEAYSLLESQPGDPVETIRRRYKKLARWWHPDNPRHSTERERIDAGKKFKKINAAWHKLRECSEQERRREEQEATQRREEAGRQAELEAQRRAEAEAARARAEADRLRAFQQAMAEERKRQYDALSRWTSLASGAVFICLLAIALVANGIEKRTIEGQNAKFGPLESPQEPAILSMDWRSYQSEKDSVASDLLGRRVSMTDLDSWHPPYADPQGDEMSRTIYERLLRRNRFDELRRTYEQLVERNPQSASAHNKLAWFLAICPDTKFRDPRRAVDSAKRAVELAPRGFERTDRIQQAVYRNTLGVAFYRAHDWTAAERELQMSTQLKSGGDSFDWFFLSMVDWQLGYGHEVAAQQDYAMGVEWMEKNSPNDDDLKRFRSEAAEVLGLLETTRQQGSVP
jgi:curved DNA-binding protein CbpA